MSEYYPDRWVVVEIDYGTEVIKKVLASWYGGFAGSDSWKLSSGITETIEHDDYYEFHNYSGSVYKCNKRSNGMSGYTRGIYTSFEKKLEGHGSIKILEEYDRKISR
jgi:hypothetical protein